jgi:UDP-glucose 4-epimerase
MKYFITGGTGSFGNAMIENLIRDPGVDEIRVYSRDEVKQEQLVLKYGSKVTCILGDVRDKDALYRAMKGCTHVFCAAAMKQVPACEANVLNALSVNVQGTINTVEVALQHNVSSVVFLSTDKAVEPITVMGMTKSLAEKSQPPRECDLPCA